MKALRDATPLRLLVGLGLGLFLGLGLVQSAAETARWLEERATLERAARAELMALAEALGETGGAGEKAPAVIASWLGQGSALREIRVIHLANRVLAASSAAKDRPGGSSGAAPRQLLREEKPLFDLAQTLRAALEENREAGRAVKEEIDVRRDEGVALLAAPILVGSEFVGIVEAQATVRPATPPLPWVRPLVIGLLALGGFALATRLLAARRGWLVTLAALLLLGALAAHGQFAWGALVQRQVAGEERGAAGLSRLAERFATTLRDEGPVAAGSPVATPRDARRWDADLFRVPRGVVVGGALDRSSLDALAELTRHRGQRRVALAGVVALLLASFVGLGAAVRLWETIKKYHVAYAYAVPALLGMLLLVFFPFFYGIGLAFTNSNIYNSDKPLTEIWVGLDNFEEILGDFGLVKQTEQGSAINYRNFYYTLGFTVIWTVSNVTIGVSLGLLLALVLNTKGLRFKALYRVLLILPWAVPNYITALIWKGMFHQQFGVINQFLQIVGLSPISWFERPISSFATVLTTNGWLSFPFMMVISLGALQSIPADLYEAARVDGATRWQQFRTITLPSLKPALVPAVILSVIWTFNMFNIIYLVSEGQPAGATEILITQAYKLAFEQYRYGYAAAYSTVIFLILFTYGTWQNRVTKATEAI